MLGRPTNTSLTFCKTASSLESKHKNITTSVHSITRQNSITQRIDLITTDPATKRTKFNSLAALKMMQLVLFLATFALIQSVVNGFVVTLPSICSKTTSTAAFAKDIKEDETENSNGQKGFFGEFFDIFKNMDDVAEDFFYKRMGKGEIFYGKRKYKPSGDVEGEYNGFGLSDKLKIDMTREYKEAWLEEKRMRDEMRAIKEEKERKDAARYD